MAQNRYFQIFQESRIMGHGVMAWNPFEAMTPFSPVLSVAFEAKLIKSWTNIFSVYCFSLLLLSALISALSDLIINILCFKQSIGNARDLDLNKYRRTEVHKEMLCILICVKK